MSDIECPYCGATDDDCVSDLWEYEGDDNEVECASCEKEFSFSVEVSYSYEVKRKSCGHGNHDASAWTRFDYERNGYSLWSRDCANCDDYQIEKVEYLGDLPKNLEDF